MHLLREHLRSLLRIIPKDTRRRLGIHLGVPDVHWSLAQLKNFGFSPNQVIDVGAYQGEWARACLTVFPRASITCIEPQASAQRYLREMASKNRRIRVIRGLLGKRFDPSVRFYECGSGSSILGNQGRQTTGPMTTIDTLIADGICECPQMIKLDVQGYEIEVLKGFEKNISQCDMIQCELSLLPIVSGAPLIHEVVAYLHTKGFVMFDVTELIRAPSDGCVWQIDAMFCRIDSALRRERSWLQ